MIDAWELSDRNWRVLESVEFAILCGQSTDHDLAIYTNTLTQEDGREAQERIDRPMPPRDDVDVPAGDVYWIARAERERREGLSA